MRETINAGDRSPWGKIDYIDEQGDGLIFVSTPGHGGLWVRKDRQKEIPTALGRKTWYEEDCEIAIPGVVFKELQHTMKKEEWEKTLINWFPEKWERWTKRKVEKGMSLIRDEELFKAEHSHHFIVQAAFGSWHETVPEGKAGVVARREYDGSEIWKLVDDEDYKQRSRFGFVIVNPYDHEDWINHA